MNQIFGIPSRIWRAYYIAFGLMFLMLGSLIVVSLYEINLLFIHLHQIPGWCFIAMFALDRAGAEKFATWVCNRKQLSLEERVVDRIIRTVPADSEPELTSSFAQAKIEYKPIERFLIPFLFTVIPVMFMPFTREIIKDISNSNDLIKYGSPVLFVGGIILLFFMWRDSLKPYVRANNNSVSFYYQSGTVNGTARWADIETYTIVTDRDVLGKVRFVKQIFRDKSGNVLLEVKTAGQQQERDFIERLRELAVVKLTEQDKNSHQNHTSSNSGA